MSKALVISGGGSKGAFAVGVVKELIGLYRLSFNTMVGTSTGALIVPFAALGELQKLEELYTTVEDRDIYEVFNIGNRVNSTSIYSATPLTETVKKYYTDDFFNRLKNCGTKIYLTTVCLQTEELVVFTTADTVVANSYYKTRKLVNGEQFRRAVVASASQPVFMPPVKINKLVPGEPNPEFQFVDGGVREYAGVGIATDTGASEIFTILHSAKGGSANTQPYTDLLSVLMQTVSVFITDVGDNDLYVPGLYNQGLSYIRRVKENMRNNGIAEADIRRYFSVPGTPSIFQDRDPLTIHLIRPETPLDGGPGGLTFDRDKMKAMVEMGKTAFEAYAANLPPGWNHTA